MKISNTLLLLLLIVLIILILGCIIFIKTNTNDTSEVVERFATETEMKESSGYKSQLASVSALTDSRFNGRRDMNDMLSSEFAPPLDEQCFVNFHVLTARFGGYLGPFKDGYMDPDQYAYNALKMGFRSIMIEIDYYDTCNYEPRLAIRDVNGRAMSLEPTTPECTKGADIKALASAIRKYAFTNAVANPNDPLIIILYILRVPPRDKTGKQVLNYLSTIAEAMEPLLDKSIDSLGSGGTFSRQQQESTLLTLPITDLAGHVIFMTNADTTGFRNQSYRPSKDLDYIVNLRLTYQQAKLGCTKKADGSLGGIETVESFMTVPDDQIDNTINELKLKWTCSLSADPSVIPTDDNCDKLLTTFGVHSIPVPIWTSDPESFWIKQKSASASASASATQPPGQTANQFSKWSFIPKAPGLRFTKPPVAVPAPASKKTDANGGLLRMPTSSLATGGS